MIDREQVRKVALLARLELTPQEEETFTAQVGSILDVVPTTRAIDVSNVTRPDRLQPYPEREAILNGAPQQEGEFFKVPKIMNVE
jgi:aspartyl-tRNA(Asn)/glutamyl-tRNA(Gln) amidotransferase subunit C